MLNRIVKCPCCLKPTDVLDIHHWFEPPDYTMYSSKVCEACNAQLQPRSLWPSLFAHRFIQPKIYMSHVLPTWKLQCLFTRRSPDREGNEEFERAIIQTYKKYRIPLPPLPNHPLVHWCARCTSTEITTSTLIWSGSFLVRQYLCRKCYYITVSPIPIQPRDNKGRFTKI